MARYPLLMVLIITTVLLNGCRLIPPRAVTRAQAARLHAGMTYRQVVNILGSPGEREAVADSISEWKSDSDGNRVMVEYRNGKVFLSRFHYGAARATAESSALYRKYSRLTLDMPRSEVEKILGSPGYTKPIRTDAAIYRWEMTPKGNTLIVKFKANRLFDTRVDTWTAP